MFLCVNCYILFRHRCLLSLIYIFFLSYFFSAEYFVNSIAYLLLISQSDY